MGRENLFDETEAFSGMFLSNRHIVCPYIMDWFCMYNTQRAKY